MTKIVHDKSGAGLAKVILESEQKRKIKTDTTVLDSMIVLQQCLENIMVLNKPYQS